MDTPTDAAPRSTQALLLAGLGAGTLAAFALLAWMGVAAVTNGRSFWTPEYLAFRAVFDSSGLRAGDNLQLASGLAVYVAAYGALGGIFALLVRDRLPRFRLLVAGVLFAVCWDYLASGVVWREFEPALLRFHGENATLGAHIVYGYVLARLLTRAPVELSGTAAPAPDPAPAASQPAEPGNPTG